MFSRGKCPDCLGSGRVAETSSTPVADDDTSIVVPLVLLAMGDSSNLEASAGSPVSKNEPLPEHGGNFGGGGATGSWDGSNSSHHSDSHDSSSSDSSSSSSGSDSGGGGGD